MPPKNNGLQGILMESPDSKISNVLGSSGAYNLMDFCRKHPQASLVELARVLGEVKPADVEKRLVDEAQDLDELRGNVQELLYRYVLNVGAGWPASADANAELREQLASWQRCIRGAHFEAVLAAVSDSLLAATHIPGGWKPDKASHEWLAEPFAKNWKTP